RNCYGLSGCSPPWTDLTVKYFGHRGLLLPGFRQVRSPLPSLDITTTVTGLLCWRDSHPLEWQLASLHWSRPCSCPPSDESCKGLQRQRSTPCPRTSTAQMPRSALISVKPHSMWSVWMMPSPLCCFRSGRVGRSKHG